MMKEQHLQFLYEEIEVVREEMHRVARVNGLFHEETVRMSQILDYLIVQYQKMYHVYTYPQQPIVKTSRI